MQAAAGGDVGDDSGSKSTNAAKAALNSQQGQPAKEVGTKPIQKLTTRPHEEPSTIGQPPNTPADGSSSQQTHADTDGLRAEVSAQSSPSSAQQESAGAHAAAAVEEAAAEAAAGAAAAKEAADRSQQLPAGSDHTGVDVPATQPDDGGDAAEAPAEPGEWQEYVVRQVGNDHELVPASGAERAQGDASCGMYGMSPGDKLAVDAEPRPGRVDTLAGSSPDRHPGSAKSSEAQGGARGLPGVSAPHPPPQEPRHAMQILTNYWRDARVRMTMRA